MFLRRSQLLEHYGSTFGNGLFGAPKGDTGEPGFSVEECILRVIINAVPPNEIQATIEAELDNLPAFSQWALLGPLDREAVLGFSEEQSCCFYLCGLEDAWLPFFVLDAEGTEPIEAADVDASWAAVCVFPMGWRSACGIVQHLSMQLVRQARQRGPGADGPATLGRITGLPASAADRLLRFLQACPDVNEQGRVVVRPTESQGLPSEMQQALRDVCAEWGVARSEKKASFDVLKGLTLCVEILAQHGRARPASLSICKFWSLLWHAMGFDAWRPSHLSNMGGVQCFFKQFRRPSFIVFCRLWDAILENPPAPSWTDVADELLWAACLMPLDFVPDVCSMGTQQQDYMPKRAGPSAPGPAFIWSCGKGTSVSSFSRSRGWPAMLGLQEVGEAPVSWLRPRRLRGLALR